VLVDRLITTYLTNADGLRDGSHREVTTLRTLARMRLRWHALISGKYPRHKLGDDGTDYPPGQAIVQPKTIRAEARVFYDACINDAWVSDPEGFATVSEFVRRNPTLTKVIGGSVIAFGALAGAMGSALTALSVLNSAVGVIKTAQTLGLLASATKFASGAGGLLTTAFGGMKAALAAIVSPIGLAVASVASLGIAIHFVVKNWEHYSKVWSGYIDGLVGSAMTAGIKIAEFLKPVYELVGYDIDSWIANQKKTALTKLQIGTEAADLDAAEGGVKLWEKYFSEMQGNVTGLFSGEPEPLPSERFVGPSPRGAAPSGRVRVSVDVTAKRPSVEVSSDSPSIEVPTSAGVVMMGAT
jgi:hypothetical protein